MRWRFQLHALTFFATNLVFLSFPASAAPMQRHLVNEKGGRFDAPSPHPLSWWTRDPLRLDATGDLMLDSPAAGGEPITADAYAVQRKLELIGVAGGSRIVQITLLIRAKPRVVRRHPEWFLSQPFQWKSLLVRPGLGGIHGGLPAP